MQNRSSLRNTILRAARPVAPALLAWFTVVGCHAAEPDVNAAAIEAFLDACGRRGREALADEKPALAGKDGWIFLAQELRHLGAGKFWGPQATAASQASRDDAKDPVPAILDFARQLDALGIELILVPVPPRAILYADKVDVDAPPPLKDGIPVRCDPHHQDLYAMLRDAGLTVLDLTDTLLAERRHDAEQGPVCCRHDTHWSSRACAVAAGEIAKLVKERPWLAGVSRRTYAAETVRQTITGDLYTMLGDEKLARETLTLHRVGLRTEAGLEPIQPGAASPVLLLADSHGLVFHVGEDMHATGAGLADHLAWQLGFPLDMIARRGSAATSIRVDLARKFYRDEAYRAGKKLIVWCFAAREFTETMGWRKLRITR